jgi:hypothetical protein
MASRIGPNYRSTTDTNKIVMPCDEDHGSRLRNWAAANGHPPNSLRLVLCRKKAIHPTAFAVGWGAIQTNEVSPTLLSTIETWLRSTAWRGCDSKSSSRW